MKEDEKDEGYYQSRRGKGMMMVMAALLLAVGLMGGAFLLSKADFSPNVNVTSSAPNVYVSSTPQENSIGVSATATKDVAPDLLEIGIRVQTQSDNAQASQQENADVTKTLLAKLKALGINDSDIQTTSYSVDPVYSSNYACAPDSSNCVWNSNLTGYSTTQTFNVDITQLDLGGAVIDAASQSGENETFVDSTSFTLKPDTRDAVENTLLEEASADAKIKAQNIADGLGVSLGKVLSASEDNYYYPSPLVMKSDIAASGAVAPSTQLSPGTLEISTSVSVSYEVGN